MQKNIINLQHCKLEQLVTSTQDLKFKVATKLLQHFYSSNNKYIINTSTLSLDFLSVNSSNNLSLKLQTQKEIPKLNFLSRNYCAFKKIPESM